MESLYNMNPDQILREFFYKRKNERKTKRKEGRKKDRKEIKTKSFCTNVNT